MHNPAPLQKLPEKISGKNVELYAFTPAAWDRIREMNSLERTKIIECLRLPTKQASHFASRLSFSYFCLFARLNEKPDSKRIYMPRREYFVCSLEKDCFVGTVTAYMPQPAMNVMAIGYEILSEHRGSGYAPEASKLLTDCVLRKQLFSCICAETKIANEASARVLVKSGFREAAQGLCSTTDVPDWQNLRVRRFIKAPTTPETWPLPVYGA